MGEIQKIKQKKLINKNYKGSRKHKYIIYVYPTMVENGVFIITNKIKEPKRDLNETNEIFDYVKIY